MRASGSSLRRFVSASVDVERSAGLRPDHPALQEGRTIFPSMVVGTDTAPRFLVSGHNNPKLGKVVTKGPRAGWPIFQVSLEERATCPRSCAMWGSCYGNAMPYARRHRPDVDFIPALKAEVWTLARANRDGLLIRLHALGDFYSPEYVVAWAELLERLPQLHVFGYTARREDADDMESRRTALAIRRVSERAWDRFAIRFSRDEPGPQRAVVFDQDPGRPDVVMCPAQTDKTAACATCGLCWAAGARERTVGFLRHGMKRSAGPRPPRLRVVTETPAEPETKRPRGRPRLWTRAWLPYDDAEVRLGWVNGVPVENIARLFGCSAAEIERRAVRLGLEPRE